MIRTRLHLQANEGGAQQVLDFYRKRGILERSIAQPGCLSAEIGVSLTDSDRVTVSALWESEAAYQGWIDQPSRAEDVTALLPLLEPTASGVEFGSLGTAELTRIVESRPAS